MSQLQQIRQKVCSWEEARRRIAQLQDWGKEVVFTNGCFDLLHYGHIHYLSQARDLGDALVIGMNSADSVRRLKGAHRPINDEQTRIMLLAALEMVDILIIFEQDTPLELIQTLRPDVLVKGGDYSIETIVGAKEVLEWGGSVQTLAFVDNYSTTAIETKIRSWDKNIK